MRRARPLRGEKSGLGKDVLERHPFSEILGIILALSDLDQLGSHVLSWQGAKRTLQLGAPTSGFGPEADTGPRFIYPLFSIFLLLN
jgi:hypothetical protein